MKNNMNKLRTLFGFLMIISLSFISCHSLWEDLNEQEDSFVSNTAEVVLTDVNLEKATEVTSDDTSIASVEIDADGKVIITSHGEGETVITIKDDSRVAKVKVTVNAKGEITLTVLEVPYPSKTEEVDLAEINLTKATYVSSDDESIVTVEIDENGKVIITSRGEGETEIIIKDGLFAAKVKVTVNAKGEITLTVLEKATKQDYMSTKEFIEALGTKVETITCDATKGSGVVLSNDGKTVNVYGVKLKGEFSSDTKFPGTLVTADLSGLDISEVTKLTSMFEGCSNLTNIDLSKLDTSKVTDMSKMFAECTALKELDLRGFDTSKVTNSTDIFLHDGTAASPLKIKYKEEKWKLGTEATTGGATKLYFEKPLFEIPVADFNSIVYSVEVITYDTTKPFGIEKSTDEKTANINGVKVIVNGSSSPLKFGRNLKKADLRGLDVSEITSMNQSFGSCGVLEELNVSNWDTSKVTDMYAMFFRCYLLTKLDISSFDTSNVTTMENMFDQCNVLQEIKIDVNKFNTSKVTSMVGMFSECAQLKNMDVSKFDTSSVTSMTNMFTNCKQLQKLDVSNWNTSKVTNMGSLFSSCQVISELDVSKWDTSNVTNMVGIFDCCMNLESIDVSEWVTSNVTQMDNLFSSCKKITSIDVSNFDTSKVTVMGRIFSGCESLESIDVSNFNTSSVTNMSMMFQGCGKITELDLSNFDTSKVTVMDRLFYNCVSLEKINLSNFDTSNLEKEEDNFIFAAVGTEQKPCDVIIGANWTLHTPSNYTYKSSYDTQSCYLNFTNNSL